MGLVFVLAPVVLPQIAMAQLGAPSSIGQPGQMSCPRDLGYICTDGSVASIFRLILNWAMTIAFLAAVIYLIYGGFQYISSAGNQDRATKGRTTIVNAIIGIVIIILSYTIVQIVYNFVARPTGGPGM